jgi:hypothetical protein
VNIRNIAAGILSPPPAAAAAAATTATPATRRSIGDIIGSFWNDKRIAKLFMNAKDVAANCCMETILHHRIELLGKAINDAKTQKFGASHLDVNR